MSATNLLVIHAVAAMISLDQIHFI